MKEEDKVQEQWYKDAEEQTLETLPRFLRHLSEDYAPDYGTIVHVLAAGAVATTWALNQSETGGITGFQASQVMWGYMMHWAHVAPPARLIQFEDMLYPQYTYRFEKNINEETWKWIQEQAKKKIETKKAASSIVKAHWESIVAGKVPFGYEVKEE